MEDHPSCRSAPNRTAKSDRIAPDLNRGGTAPNRTGTGSSPAGRARPGQAGTGQDGAVRTGPDRIAERTVEPDRTGSNRWQSCHAAALPKPQECGELAGEL